MDKLIDDVARIFATPMPRRQACKLLGATFAATLVTVFGGVTLKAAQCSREEARAGNFNCGNGVANTICCPRNTCCAKKGNSAACCTIGRCICSNGTCASSTGAVCPKNCVRCVPPGRREHGGSG